MGRRGLEIVAGSLLALVIAGFLWTLLYAGITAIRSQDPAVIKALMADDILAGVRHAWRHRAVLEAQINMGLAALAAGAAAGAALFQLLRRRIAPLGDAAFMTTMDARAAGYLGDRGLFFGRMGGSTLSWQKRSRDAKTGEGLITQLRRLWGGRWLIHPRLVHAVIVGPTRSGKGTGLIIPNALLWPHSLIVLDIRGETFEQSAGYRSRFSQVFVFAPGQSVSHGYNPLDFVRAGHGHRDSDIRAIAASIIPAKPHEDEYWSKDARELVAGVVSVVLETRHLKSRSLRDVIGILQGEIFVIDRIAMILGDESDPLSAFTRRTLAPFLAMPEKQFAGLYGNLRVALQPFANELVLRATAFSSFRLADFRSEATTLYIDFRLSQVETIAPVVNLLLSQLVHHLADHRLKPGERPLLMLLDEFANLGKLEPVLAMWKILAGNGVAVWAFVQSLTDIDRHYGREGRTTLIDNSELQMFLGSQSPEVLEHFEKLLGNRTVTLTSRSITGGLMSQHRSHAVSTRELAVPLMSRDALRRLDADRFIVLPMGQKPILARKNFFFADRKLRSFAGLQMSRRFRLPDLEAAIQPGLDPKQTGFKGGTVGMKPTDWPMMPQLASPSDRPGRVWKSRAPPPPPKSDSLRARAIAAGAKSPRPKHQATKARERERPAPGLPLEAMSALTEMITPDEAPELSALGSELQRVIADLAAQDDRDDANSATRERAD